jgi:hypothetical protein
MLSPAVALPGERCSTARCPNASIVSSKRMSPLSVFTAGTAETCGWRSRARRQARSRLTGALVVPPSPPLAAQGVVASPSMSAKSAFPGSCRWAGSAWVVRKLTREADSRHQRSHEARRTKHRDGTKRWGSRYQLWILAVFAVCPPIGLQLHRLWFVSTRRFLCARKKNARRPFEEGRRGDV